MVLTVEDEGIIQQHLVGMLRAFGHTVVGAARGGGGGLSDVRERPPDFFYWTSSCTE